MPKRYCGQVTIEIRGDERPGWECFTCFISARDPADPTMRGKSIGFYTFPYPIQVGPHMWEDLARETLRRGYGVDDDAKRTLFLRAIAKDASGNFKIRRTR